MEIVISGELLALAQQGDGSAYIKAKEAEMRDAREDHWYGLLRADEIFILRTGRSDAELRAEAKRLTDAGVAPPLLDL